MTPQERKNLAEQLLSNPLWAELFDGVEKSATEAMIYATDDETRAAHANRVLAIRHLRGDCEANLRSDRPRKSAAA